MPPEQERGAMSECPKHFDEVSSLTARVDNLEEDLEGEDGRWGLKQKVEAMWRHHIWLPLSLACLLGVVIGCLIATVILKDRVRYYILPPSQSQELDGLPPDRLEKLPPRSSR